jgi:sucrose-6-phosphate hydrolase SacC (GH32 family)
MENTEVLVQEARLRLSPGEPLGLRVFLDGCMLEVFANGRQALCQQIWPTRDDSLDIRFLARDGNARINTLKAWEMKAASEIYEWMTEKE